MPCLLGDGAQQRGPALRVCHGCQDSCEGQDPPRPACNPWVPGFWPGQKARALFPLMVPRGGLWVRPRVSLIPWGSKVMESAREVLPWLWTQCSRGASEAGRELTPESAPPCFKRRNEPKPVACLLVTGLERPASAQTLKGGGARHSTRRVGERKATYPKGTRSRNWWGWLSTSKTTKRSLLEP